MTSKDNLPRRQHYLPQFYLRGFTDKGPRRKQGMLRVVDIHSGRCFSSQPKDVANIRDYYVAENADGEASFKTETEILQRIDSEAAHVIRNIEEKRTLPQGRDWESLCAFVASLEVRVPIFRQASYEMSKHIADIWMHCLFDGEEAFAKMKSEYQKETGKSIGITYQEAKKSMEAGEYDVEVPRSFDVAMMLDVLPMIANTICRMTPHLLFATEKARFITGDAPIHKFDNDSQRRESGLRGVGWNTPEVEVSIPLTQNCCLGLDWTADSLLLRADDACTAAANTNTMRASWQYLFASGPDFAFLGPDHKITWGETEALRVCASRSKEYATQIMGGPIPRKPVKKIRR